MQHFLLMASNIDVLPLLYAVSRQPGLWDQHTLRTTHPGTPHSQVSDILLRFQDTSEYEATGDPASIVDGHESTPYPAWWCLPEVRPLVFGLMSRVQAARLGRVILTKLRPGCRITPHKDSAPHSVYYQRHHVTLCTPRACYFRIEDETLHLPEGTCYYVNNAVEHEVWNDGPTERLALIIDLHSDPTPPPPAGVSGGALAGVLSGDRAAVAPALARGRERSRRHRA